MNWELGKATDYFDNSNMNCIWEYSQEYGKLSLSEKPVIDMYIKRQIEGWLDQIESYNSSLLPVVLGTIVDDIYRSGNLTYYYNDDVADYLRVTSKVVMDWYTRKGIHIHYMTNNTFSDYTRPLIMFPAMLQKSGLIYICPQHIMWTEMEKQGIPFEHFALYVNDYKALAIEKTNDLIKRCFSAGIHYIHLDIDAGFSAFDNEFAFIGKANHVLVFREDAPQDSARVMYL